MASIAVHNAVFWPALGLPQPHEGPCTPLNNLHICFMATSETAGGGRSLSKTILLISHHNGQIPLWSYIKDCLLFKNTTQDIIYDVKKKRDYFLAPKQVAAKVIKPHKRHDTKWHLFLSALRSLMKDDVYLTNLINLAVTGIKQGGLWFFFCIV